jgi:hypothetical protein
LPLKSTHVSAPVDWSDPDQASTQAKIDVLRDMISHNPMSYSEKEELVRLQLADQSRSDKAKKETQEKNPTGKWGA